MDKICYCKWDGWMAPVVALLSLSAVITAQPGFLSINCGANTNYTAENNITWITDADYIDMGQSADTMDATKQSFGSYLQSLRFFPKPLNKPCYQLPVAPHVPYLLRIWFAVGNFSGYQQLPSFSFSIETVDMLASRNVITYRDSPSSYEYILVTSGKVLYICLVRTSETDDPFISAIELRRLQNGMYEQAKPGTILVSQSRSDVGGYSIVRYPQDKFDRIWTPSNSYSNLRNLSSKEPVITNNTEDFPPIAVMQTAWITSTESYTFELRSLEGSIIPGLLVLYFAEIETLNMSESRSFYVAIDGVRQPEAITLVRNYSALEVKFLSDITANKFELVEDTKSTLPPIINGYEHYSLLGTELATYSQDLEVLDALQRRFHMKDWISDPCYLIPWDGIGCDSSYSTFRIFEIDLSGRNLTGSVPNDIAQLTALVNV